MKVTITVGNTTREFEVRSDLVDLESLIPRGQHNDTLQNNMMHVVSSHFVSAYKEEYSRVVNPGDGGRITSERCGAPTTKNATSAENYTTCRGVLEHGECPDASNHVEL